MKIDPASPWFSHGNYRVFYLPETDSTNTRMKLWARGDCPVSPACALQPYDLIAANLQTGGRGRLGRQFVSPGSGLYFSVLIPEASPERAARCTPVCAAAMALALEGMGFQDIGVKWVNDLYRRGRKIAGILCEWIPEGVVCGIGLNVTAPPGGFPKEAGPAGALSDSPVCAEEILSRFMDALRALLQDPSRAHRVYRERMFLLGQHVTCARGREYLSGVCEDVGEDYSLLLRLEDGKEIALSSGEVIHVRPKEEHDASGIV